MPKLNELVGMQSKVAPNTNYPQLDEANNYHSLGELFGRAVRDESLLFGTVPTAISDIIDTEHKLDVNFNDSQKEEMFESRNIDDSFKRHIFDTAKNQDHMQELLSEFEVETQKEREIEEMGVAGWALRLGAVALDTPLFLVAPLTAPVMTARVGATFGRRMLVGGAVEGGIEGINSVIGERERTNAEIGLAVAFGGLANGILGKPNKELVDSAKKAINRKYGIDENLQKQLDEADAKGISREDILREHAKDLNLSEEGLRSYTDGMNDLQKAVEKGWFEKTVFDKLRVDTAWLTAKSPSETMQQFSKQMFPDATLQRNLTNEKFGQEIFMEVEESLMQLRHNEFMDIQLEFAQKALGKNWATARVSEAENILSYIAGSAQMKRNLGTHTDDLVKKSIEADLIREGFPEAETAQMADRIITSLDNISNKSWDILNRYQKRGFDGSGVPKTNTYMPIVYAQNTKELLEKKGLSFKELKQFVRNSIVSRRAELGLTTDMELTKEVADEFVKGITNAKYITPDKTLSMEDLMRGTLERVSSREGVDKSSDVFTETRSLLDYKYKQNFYVNGREISLGFEDLVNKNYFGVMNQYSKKMGGATTLEKLKFRVDDIEATTSKKKLLVNLSNSMKEAIKKNDEIFLNEIIDEAKKIIGSEADQVAKTTLELNSYFKGIAKQTHKTLDSLVREGKIARDSNEYNELFSTEFEKLVNPDFVNSKYSKFDELSKTEKDIDLSNDLNIDEVKKKMTEEMITKGVSQRDINTEIARFDDLLKELKGVPTATDPFSDIAQGQRILRNLNIARLLGQTGITMTAELGGAVFHMGVRNFLSTMPEAWTAVLKQMKTGKLDNKLAQEIQTTMNLGSTLTRGLGLSRYEHDYDMSSVIARSTKEDILNRLEATSEKFAEATLMVGGTKPMTAMLEMSMAVSTINEVIEMAGKKTFTNGDLKWFNELGIDLTMANRIKAQIDKHGKYKKTKWSNNHKVMELNSDAWDDLEAMDALVTGTRRITNTIIQKSYMGDKAGVVFGKNMFKNTVMGKMFLELKDYMITSYVKQAGRAIGRKDMYTAGLMLSQIGALTLGTSIQNLINYSGNPDRLEESFKPENLARNIIGKMPSSSYIPTVIDSGVQTLTGEEVFSQTRYHSGIQNGLMSIPTIDLLMKTQSLMSMPFRGISKGELSDKDISAFGALPLSNTIFTKPLLELAKSQND